MSHIEIRIPQLGEGLHEARIVRFLKQPGESVEQDEPIYEMETDKATMEIESPVAGVIEEWSAKEDDVVLIGAVIGRICQDGVSEGESGGGEGGTRVRGVAETDRRSVSAGSTQQTNDPARLLRAGRVPPRTRSYAREKGVSDVDLVRLAGSSDVRLLPEAIDRFLMTRADASKVPPARTVDSAVKPIVAKANDAAYEDIELPQRQRTLVYRLEQGTRAVIPATMEVRLDWGPIEAARSRFKLAGGDGPQPTQFLLFAWCVAQAAEAHPSFRSALVSDTTLRRYERLHLGIAVARPGDELLMARIANASALKLADFITAASDAIEKARQGTDQASDAMQISLTNMAGVGVRIGIPVLVAPSVATLFVGEPFDEAYPLPGGGIGFRRSASMVMTFDHRIANGIGAANFLAEIRRRVESLFSEVADLKRDDRR